MLKFVAASENQEFVVVTENGILYELRKQNPDKKFYALSDMHEAKAGDCECANCKYMKYNTLENILSTLETETPELILDEALMEAARRPIERMLEFK